MAIKIRVEISALATQRLSGVANYTGLLLSSLQESAGISAEGVYFNFLNRQPDPEIEGVVIKKNVFFPLRVYAKLQSHRLAPAFDMFLPRVDLTIFPNFATWPVIKSKWTATVIHDLTYIHYPDLVEKNNLPHLQRVVPRSIKNADIIITVSESVKSELVTIFNMNPDRCIVTPIPPHKSFFLKSSRDIYKKYKIPTRKYIYFIGTLEPRKNLSTLVQAYCLLPDNIKKEYSLILAGAKGWKTTKSERAIQQAIDSGENIKHLGFIDQDDSPALMQNASLFVMPSLYEGFGMPVLEAMASKTPVVCSDIPVLQEAGGGACLYADKNSSEDFAHKIEQIIRDNRLKKDLVRQGFKRASELSWSHNMHEIKLAVERLEHPKN